MKISRKSIIQMALDSKQYYLITRAVLSKNVSSGETKNIADFCREACLKEAEQVLEETGELDDVLSKLEQVA